MSNKTYQTTLLIRGDSKDAVRSVQLTQKQLEDLTGTQKRGISVTQKYREAFNEKGLAVAKWGAGVALAAGAATAAMVKAGLASVDSLAKTSDKLGVTTEALAQMRFAAEQTGVSTGTMDMALQRMTRRVAEAAQGSGEAVNALKELGISAEDLVKKSPDQMFRQITDSMGGVENQADKVRLAMKLFDSEGVALVNTMKGGVGALDQFAKEADAAGLSISRIDAAKVEAANDAFNRVRSVVTGLSQQLAIRFAPILEGIADRMFGIATESGGAAAATGKAFNHMMRAAGMFGDSIRALQVAWHLMKLAFQESYRFIFAGFNQLELAARKMWNALPWTDKVEVGTAISGFLATLDYEIAESRRKLDELLSRPLPSDAIEQFVADSQRAFEAQAITIASSSAAMVDSLEEVTVTAQRVAKEDFTALTKAAEENADGVAVAYARGIERMDDGFADFFKNILRTGKVTFDNLKNIFLDTLGEMIYAAARNKIIVGLGFGGGSSAAMASGGGGIGGLASIGSLLKGGVSGIGSSLAGAGSSLMTGVGHGAGFLANMGVPGMNELAIRAYQQGMTMTAGSMLAGAGAGLLGGLAGNAVFGQTSGIGSGLGGIAGFALGGPLGAGIGSFLGSGIESLFGSSGNKRAGVGINTGTGLIETFGKGGNLKPAEEIGNALMQFSQAIGGSGSMLEIAAGNKTGLQLNGEKFADATALINAAMDDILKTSWNLAPVVRDLAIAFEGSLEETAAYATAIQGLWQQARTNPVSQAVDDFAAAQQTAGGIYRTQSDNLRALIRDFDGSTSSAQQLSQALAGTQQVAYALTQQFLQTRQQIGQSGAESARSIREAGMSESELRQSLFDRRKDLRGEIGTAIDPGEIQRAVQEALSVNQRLFQMIEDPTTEQAEKFATTAESFAEAGERRIDRLISETRKESQQQNAEIRALLTDAAADLQASATTQQNAAEVMLQAAQIIASTFSSNSFAGGSEVVV